MAKVLSMMSYLSHYDQAMTDKEKLLAFELWCVLIDKTFRTIKSKSHRNEIEKYKLKKKTSYNEEEEEYEKDETFVYLRYFLKFLQRKKSCLQICNSFSATTFGLF